MSVTASQKNSIDYDDVQSSLDDSSIANHQRKGMIGNEPIEFRFQEKKASLPNLARMTDFAPANTSTRRSSNFINMK